jgi:hypothetical protein
LTGISSSYWSLQPSHSLDFSYWDGLGSLDEYVFGLAFQDLAKSDPDLFQNLKFKPISRFPNHPFSQSLDKIWKSVDLEQARKSCAIIREKSRKEIKH